MSNIEIVDTPEILNLIADDWDRLLKGANFYYPRIDYVQNLMVEPSSRTLVVLARGQDGSIKGLACFSVGKTPIRFTVGERLLFSLPVRTVSKLGYDCLGSLNVEDWGEALRLLARQYASEVIDLGEVPTDSTLLQAVAKVGRNFVVARSARKASVRWFIDLPTKFEEYLAQLRPSTRKSLTYKSRRLDRELATTLVPITGVEQVDDFLRDGEIISRRTYQWNVGQRLENDTATRDHFKHLAKHGLLRCYMLYAGDEPIAFLRGEVQNEVYHYETPGFDPAFDKHSPGLVLLFWVLRDLTEVTTVNVFDFGPGGDFQGYKARFGTRAVTCEPLMLFFPRRPLSMLLFIAQTGFSSAKNFANAVVGQGQLRQRIKKVIRKYDE